MMSLITYQDKMNALTKGYNHWTPKWRFTNLCLRKTKMLYKPRATVYRNPNPNKTIIVITPVWI